MLNFDLDEYARQHAKAIIAERLRLSPELDRSARDEANRCLQIIERAVKAGAIAPDLDSYIEEAETAARERNEESLEIVQFWAENSDLEPNTFSETQRDMGEIIRERKRIAGILGSDKS